MSNIRMESSFHFSVSFDRSKLRIFISVVQFNFYPTWPSPPLRIYLFDAGLWTIVNFQASLKQILSPRTDFKRILFSHLATISIIARFWKLRTPLCENSSPVLFRCSTPRPAVFLVFVTFASNHKLSVRPCLVVCVHLRAGRDCQTIERCSRTVALRCSIHFARNTLESNSRQFYSPGHVA